MQHLQTNYKIKGKTRSSRAIANGQKNKSTIQAKLTIGGPNDRYEQEADKVADTVMSMPESKISRVTGEDEEKVQSKPLSAQITPLVQRQPEKDDEFLQAKLLSEKGESSSTNTNWLENQLQGTKGSGNHLSDDTRAGMENRFGTDFGSVRVHTDAAAVQMNKELQAQAFTHGNDIYFNSGKYSLESPSGKHLLAHELTHTIQQKGGHKLTFIQRKESKEEQAKRLKGLNDSARQTAKTETNVHAEPHWATTIESTDLSNLSDVLSYLNNVIPDLETVTKKCDEAVSKLSSATTNIDEIKKEVQKRRAENISEYGAILKFENVKAAVDEAKKLLEEAKYLGIDGFDSWIKSFAKLSQDVNDVYSASATAKTIDLEELTNLKGKIKKLSDDFIKDKYIFTDLPPAAKKIQFVLCYFMALNSPGFSKMPALKDAIEASKHLGSIASDMVSVFGGSSGDYELYGNFETQLRDQISVREEMTKALKKEVGFKPSKSDVMNWFKSLKKASNEDVFNAYTTYASGFFTHRYNPDPKDIAANQTLDSIFNRPVTISGTRLAVCSDYAILGNKLLQLAGAKFKAYYIGIRASDEQVKDSSEFSDVHALANLSRTGSGSKSKETDFFISNMEIESTKDDGFSATRLGWINGGNPLYEGEGNTIEAAQNKALEKIADKRKKL